MTVRDISRRKLAENALRLSETRLRLAFENIPDAIAIYDADSRVQAVNTAMSVLADLPAMEILGMADCEISAHAVMALWRRLLKSAQATSTIQSEDITYPAGDDVRNFAVSRAVTEAIIALGRTLQLQIVAEGVESQLDIEYLKSHGCDQAQGYYVSRPISGDTFVHWYRTTRESRSGYRNVHAP